jgi:transcriptional regulator with XRE-family HTH domain
MGKKYPNQKTILKLFRSLKQFTLASFKEKTGIHTSLINHYENNLSTPSRETIAKIAKGLDINPDILFYSFGYLPEKERDIIRSDPYYYMDKIQKMCKNHATRYSEENINLDDLNMTRTYDYIIKSMEDKKRNDKGDT